jgi:pimeloyl-ACP methyl ester carboxylesterase
VAGRGRRRPIVRPPPSDANGAPDPEPHAYEQKFVGKYAHRLIAGGIGHNLPQEAPDAFIRAVVDVDAIAS